MNAKRRAWLFQQALPAVIFFLLFVLVLFVSLVRENPGKSDSAVVVDLPRRLRGRHVGSPVADVVSDLVEWMEEQGYCWKRNDARKNPNASDQVTLFVSAYVKAVGSGSIAVVDQRTWSCRSWVLRSGRVLCCCCFFTANHHVKEHGKVWDLLFQALENLEDVTKDVATLVEN
ncbi:hypothetical protein L484_018503 [Morus notabilis]|uniref:Uncharacterized protein n=1 Tax=Morus notabilis TaxID=981085 RepID=W9SSH9_9ROSA|nr:hypothetical protein L484_018503 [Morus notabilis]